MTETASHAANDAQLEDLYRSMHESILHFLQARVGDREEAEDLTSRTFLQALRWFDPTRTEGEARSWLFQIARSVAGDHWRKYYRHGPLAPLTDAVADTATDADQVPVNPHVEATVAAVLSSLPPHYRRVLELRFLEGASLEETARAMDVSVANAKVLQHRALKRARTTEIRQHEDLEESLAA